MNYKLARRDWPKASNPKYESFSRHSCLKFLQHPSSHSSEFLLTMISTIRRALTPNSNQAQDRDLGSINTSPADPSLLIRDSSPPPFSPIEASQEDPLARLAHASNGNVITMTEQHELIDLSTDSNAPDREREATDDSLLGPVTAADPTPESHLGLLSLDGASDDQVALPLEDAHTTNPPLPSAEPAQSTIFSQPTEANPPPSASHLGLNPRTSTTPQPSEITTEVSRGFARRSQTVERVTSRSEKASAEPQQSTVTMTGNAKAPTSAKARSPKRKRKEESPEAKTKSVKKPRGHPKKAEESTAASTQQDPSEEETAKAKDQEVTEEDNISAGNVEQQGVMEEEPPKKRGRPKNAVAATQKAKPQRAKRATHPKRTKATKAPAPQTSSRKAPPKQTEAATQPPKKRGRPSKPTNPAKTTSTATTSAPKKRGRPKKESRSAPAITSPSAKKRSQPTTTSKDTAQATNAETPKKRGRPRATEQSDATKGKRGRPKKGEIAGVKGAKPTGIVKRKRKAGRK